MIKAIGHVGLRVPDLDQSVHWATTVMGLREVTRAHDAVLIFERTAPVRCLAVRHRLVECRDGRAE